MREQSDEVLDFLYQLAKLHLGSAPGEFIQISVLSASGHPVLNRTAILAEAKTVRGLRIGAASAELDGRSARRSLFCYMAKVFKMRHPAPAQRARVACFGGVYMTRTCLTS